MPLQFYLSVFETGPKTQICVYSAVQISIQIFFFINIHQYTEYCSSRETKA